MRIEGHEDFSESITELRVGLGELLAHAEPLAPLPGEEHRQRTFTGNGVGDVPQGLSCGERSQLRRGLGGAVCHYSGAHREVGTVAWGSRHYVRPAHLGVAVEPR